MKRRAWVSVGIVVLAFAGVAVLLLRGQPSEEAASLKNAASPAAQLRVRESVPPNDVTSPVATATQVPSNALPASPASAVPTLNPLDGSLGNVEFGMSREQVIEAFGQPDIEDGPSLSYRMRGFGVLVLPQRGVAGLLIGAARAMPEDVDGHDFQGQTTEGVRIGSTEKDIVKAYGEPASRKERGGTQTRLVYHGPKSSFRFTVDRDHGLVELSVMPPMLR